MLFTSCQIAKNIIYKHKCMLNLMKKDFVSKNTYLPRIKGNTQHIIVFSRFKALYATKAKAAYFFSCDQKKALFDRHSAPIDETASILCFHYKECEQAPKNP